MSATLYLMVGLPGVGKTTLARELEQAHGAVRLTPDEWMVPLFGLRWTELDGKRTVLEGRLVWVAHQALRAGASVVLDFGCWTAEERWALRAIADLAGAGFELHHLSLPLVDRVERTTARWRDDPDATFELTADDHRRFEAEYTPPTADEVHGRRRPPPPEPFATWPAWAADRWPSLPRLDG